MRFEEIQQEVLAFRDERDWAQFHNPKDLAISISLEAAELLEIFQWSGTDLLALGKTEKLAEELADIVIYCIYLADRAGVDLCDAIAQKLEMNARRYTIEVSYGKSDKAAHS